MEFRVEEGKGRVNGEVQVRAKLTTFEEALQYAAGDGVFNYLVALVGGINLLSGLIITLSMAYVIPATDCDLKLANNEKGILASISFTGMIFSSHLFGFLSDKYGRRYVVIRCNITCSILSIIGSIAPTTSTLIIVWFANGFIVAGNITPIYVLVSEYFTSQYRTRGLLICAAISSLVGTYLPCLAWLVIPLKINLRIIGNLYFTSWRLYITLSSVPLILSTVLLLYIPESPKYLLSTGRKMETLNILRNIFVINTKKRPEEYLVEDICLDDNDALDNLDKKQGFLKTMIQQTLILFKPPLLSYMVVSCATNLGLIGAYNIIMLWLPENVSKMTNFAEKNEVTSGASLCDVIQYYSSTNIIEIQTFNKSENYFLNAIEYSIENCSTSVNKDVYFVNIIIGILQFLTFGASSKITDLTGKKPVIVIFIILASFFSFAVDFVSTDYTVIFLGAIVVLVGAVLPITISIIVDFFPTYVRTMATCICMIFGRAGASGGSQLFEILQTNYCSSSYFILSGLLLGIAVLCIMIPLKK